MDRSLRARLIAPRTCGLCAEDDERQFYVPRTNPHGTAIFAAHFAVEHPDVWRKMEADPSNKYVKALREANFGKRR